MKQLGTALVADMRAAKLEVPAADIAAGKPGKVTLTLPDTLLGSIQREAAKLGLAKFARKATATAVLSGQGYELTPKGPQTAKLQPGKPASMSWQVRATGAVHAPLKADVSGSLTGSGAAKTFSLGALMAQVTPPTPPAPAQAPAPAKFKLTLPHWGGFSLKALAIPGQAMIRVPGVGKVHSEKIVLAGILVVIALLLLAIGRSAGARKAQAERRRRFRTFETAKASEQEA